MLLLLLLAADALFVVLHLLHITTPLLRDGRFSLELDWGFAEVYQYVKEYWVVLLLLLMGARRRAPLFLLWAALFGYLLWDDSLMIHERLGRVLERTLGLSDAFWVRGRDVGEALVVAVVGGLALAVIAVTHVRSDGVTRRASRHLLRLVALLAFFGVGVDALHQMVAKGFWHTTLGTVEDAGEMVVMSMIVSLVAGLYDGPGPPSSSSSSR